MARIVVSPTANKETEATVGGYVNRWAYFCLVVAIALLACGGVLYILHSARTTYAVLLPLVGVAASLLAAMGVRTAERKFRGLLQEHKHVYRLDGALKQFYNDAEAIGQQAFLAYMAQVFQSLNKLLPGPDKAAFARQLADELTRLADMADISKRT